MRGGTHLAVGLAAAICVARYFGVHNLEAVACMAAGGIGGLLPDIDHPRAIISRYAIGIGGTVRLFVTHRGATHTLAFVALVLAALVLVKAPIALATAFIFGMVLHLVADMLTTDGVRLFRPLSGRSLRLLPYAILSPTATIIEQLTVCAAIAIPTLAIMGVRIGAA